MKVRVNQQGFSLIFVIVFIAMISSLSIIAVKMGGLRALSMYNDTKAKQAYYIAEAAFQNALFRLNQNSNWRGDIPDQPFAGGAYSANVSQASSIDDITITAVGSIGGTERTIVRVIPPPAKPFIIKAFAGTGTRDFGGNNGPALNAWLNKPRGIHKDSADNIYIADTDNHVIRYVDAATKNIYPFAGIGESGGYSCNNCDPDTALLDKPQGVFIDGGGNVYIADTDNQIVRKVIAGGNIVTVAGTSGSGGSSGDGGPATSAKLKKPRDVVVDSSGNIYIADTDNCRIRKVDLANNISTYAGDGTCSFGGDEGSATSAQFNKPRGLAIDTEGNLYIADTDNHRIRKVNRVTNVVTTIAGIGGVGGFGGDGDLAINAQLNKPEGVAVNQFGAIYIADTKNNRIRRVDPSGVITTHAGMGTPGDTGDDGLATDAQLDRPSKVLAYDDVDGHILISDTNNNRVREVTNAY